MELIEKILALMVAFLLGYSTRSCDFLRPKKGEYDVYR